MKHIPILFSTPMVQALLEDRKTQTRRILKVKGCKPFAPPLDWDKEAVLHWTKDYHPYGQPGDVLWVREMTHKLYNCQTGEFSHYSYRADMPADFWERYLPEVSNGAKVKWTPSIHMPKAACRSWLKVKDVRVERLQEISKEDAIAEGVTYHLKLEGFVTDAEGSNYHGSCPIKSYTKLWIGLNGAESWEANPWVWVIEFEPCAMPAEFLTRKNAAK